jgi:hypothetical protein
MRPTDLEPALLTSEQLRHLKELENKMPVDQAGRKVYLIAVTDGK